MLESVRQDVDRMSRTVDNLLTLARADEGRLELVRTEVDLTSCWRSRRARCRRSLRPRAWIWSSAASRVRRGADPQRLHQAFTNLIENAIKFTAPGGRDHGLELAPGGRGGRAVADTGPGIPLEAQALIFDRFYRVDRSRSRESGGSGLGLAICYEIATAHGGPDLGRQRAGKGSTFSLALPADVPTPGLGRRAAGAATGVG